MPEPRPDIPSLAPVHDQTRDLAWLPVRLTAGSFLLVQGLQKLFGSTITGSAAKNPPGVERTPSRVFLVWFLELAGAP